VISAKISSSRSSPCSSLSKIPPLLLSLVPDTGPVHAPPNDLSAKAFSWYRVLDQRTGETRSGTTIRAPSQISPKVEDRVSVTCRRCLLSWRRIPGSRRLDGRCRPTGRHRAAALVHGEPPERRTDDRADPFDVLEPRFDHLPLRT